MKADFLALSVLLFLHAAAQQQPGKPSARELLFTGSHLSLAVVPVITQKAGIRHKSGPYIPGSYPCLGGQAGINDHYHINSNFSVITGLHAGVSVRNIPLFIPAGDFQVSQPSDFHEDGRWSRVADFYLSLPVFLEKRWSSRAIRIPEYSNRRESPLYSR